MDRWTWKGDLKVKRADRDGALASERAIVPGMTKWLQWNFGSRICSLIYSDLARRLTIERKALRLRRMRNRNFLCFVAVAVAGLVAPLARGQDVPVVSVTHHESKIKFFVKASVALEGKFDRWKCTLTFTSPEVTSGVLDLEIQADSVDTGSGMKNGKLKSEKFFDVKNNPVITFHSTKIVQTSPTSFEVDGDFTIRGVSNPEKLTLTLPAAGIGLEHIDGKMVFDRKDYGMNSGIPFIKIADHVEVTIDLTAKQISGPPLTFQH
jgi:polyisoprenoid-binding protein YceI